MRNGTQATKATPDFRRISMSKGERDPLIRLSLFFWIALFLAGCGPMPKDYRVSEAAFSQKDLDFLEKQIGFKLPPGSVGLDLLHERSRFDAGIAARVKVPPESAPLIEDSLKHFQKRDVGIINGIPTRVNWWPREVKSALIDRTMHQEGALLHVLLIDQEGTLVLYVEWYPG